MNALTKYKGCDFPSLTAVNMPLAIDPISAIATSSIPESAQLAARLVAREQDIALRRIKMQEMASLHESQSAMASAHAGAAINWLHTRPAHESGMSITYEDYEYEQGFLFRGPTKYRISKTTIQTW